MNMKKLTALFCAFAMTFSLTACGGAKETSDAAAVPESSKAAEGTADGGADTGESQASGDAITFTLAETKEYSVFAILNQEYDLQDN
ncbi:MAG: carbohydrate ABC transporter substrate-binding protein, partial [Eisenbergiella sp.]